MQNPIEIAKSSKLVLFCLFLLDSRIIRFSWKKSRSEMSHDFTVYSYLEVFVDFSIDNADSDEWYDELKNSAEHSVPANYVC